MTETKFKGQDLSSYGHAINDAPDLHTARQIFLEMVSKFNFKTKQDKIIREAKSFDKSHKRFVQWSWNIILSGEGLAVLPA